MKKRVVFSDAVRNGPDMMYVNSKHISIIEPVAPGSKVGELIKEAMKSSEGAK